MGAMSRPPLRCRPTDRSPLGSSLLATPFDTLSTVFERRSKQEPKSAAALLAGASWCEMIRDDTLAARRLAGAAVAAIGTPAGAADPGVRAVEHIVSALPGVVEALGGRSPFEHCVLADLGALLTSVAGSTSATPALDLARELSWVLEIPNWMTFADRYADAGRLLDSRTDDAIERDVHLDLVRPVLEASERIASNCCRSELDFRRGRWEQAYLAASEAIALADLLGDDAGYAHVLAARIAAGQGRDRSADEHTRTAWALALKRGDRSTQWRVTGVEAFAACSMGAWERAKTLLRPLADETPDGGVGLASVRLWDGDYIEALVRTGDTGTAAAHRQRLAEEHRRVPTTWTLGLLQRSLALLDGDATDRVGAARESVATYNATGAVFEAARSQLVLAERLTDGHLMAEASAVLRSAELTFASLGAERWLERLAEIRGSVCVARTRRRLPKEFDILTRQELELVAVVGQGATNKESAAQLHVSVKTVEAYLTNIFRKLQVRSRSELVAAYCGARSHEN